MTFWEKLEQFPPIRIRLLARRHPGGPALTNDELAARMGLAAYEVIAISNQTDWKGIDAPTMKKYLEACGIDLEDNTAMKRVTVYLRGKRRHGIHIPPPFKYLREHPDWATYFQPLSHRLLQWASSAV